jgi:hypothetical protein
MNCQEVLRVLLQAAARFESKAAHHQRIEAERVALREAITQAQLLLSVRESEKPETDASVLRPITEVTRLKGGKAKGTTRRGTIKMKR